VCVCEGDMCVRESVTSPADRKKRTHKKEKNRSTCSKVWDSSTAVIRDLLQCQNRPITVSKETYFSVKRDLLQCQKRPISVSKENY
jgi:hypothetical protein